MGLGVAWGKCFTLMKIAAECGGIVSAAFVIYGTAAVVVTAVDADPDFSSALFISGVILLVCGFPICCFMWGLLLSKKHCPPELCTYFCGLFTNFARELGFFAPEPDAEWHSQNDDAVTIDVDARVPIPAPALPSDVKEPEAPSAIPAR